MLDSIAWRAYRQVTEVVAMSEASRLAALEQAGLVHPRADAVTAPLFSSGGFFLPADKVQVKYEMLRAHLAGHVPVTAAAAAHGYSRAAFYLVAAGFEQAGMAGLLDERRGRRGLAGLIAWPAAEPDFRAELAGAARPPWTPDADPREQTLTAAYQFLLGAAGAL